MEAPFILDPEMIIYMPSTLLTDHSNGNSMQMETLIPRPWWMQRASYTLGPTQTTRMRWKTMGEARLKNGDRTTPLAQTFVPLPLYRTMAADYTLVMPEVD
tara:strand:- start:1874 stop:2176 length:303 start_codon:yes stop_codon:yes gene_type:complete